ncbi:MAG: NAD-dependent epimerase/dehydratase family protein [Candidatus Coatesbacteria bacterium]
MARTRVLVTGSAGAIGQMFIDWAKDRYDFAGFDRKPTPHVEGAVVGDLTDLEALTSAARGCDAILHLGARPNAHRDYAGHIIPNNIVGVHNALEAAVRAGVKRVVLASTVQTEFGWPEGTKVSVEMPARPTNNYGASKVFAEHLGFLYSRDRGLSVICLRFGGVVTPQRGEWMQDHEGTFDPITLTGRDCCETIRHAIDAPALPYAVVPAYSLNAAKIKDLEPLTRHLGYTPQEDANVVYRRRDADETVKRTRTMLKACEAGDLETVRDMLAGDPGLVNARGGLRGWEGRDMTPLHYAAMRGRREVADLLLDAGADPRVRGGRTGRTPVHAAAFNDHADLARRLLERGGELDVFAAAGVGDDAALKALLDRDPALAKATDTAGFTALHFAASAGAVALLLDHGADPRAKDPWRQRPVLSWLIDRPVAARALAERLGPLDIFLAAALGDEPLARRLLDEDPARARALSPTDSPVGRGDPALHIAARRGHAGLVRLLLERGADPNGCDADGQTAMHMAAWRGKVDVIRVLAAGGARPDLADAEEGSTPKEWARWSHETEAVQVLEELEAKWTTKAIPSGIVLPIRRVLVTGGTTPLGRAFIEGAAGLWEIVEAPAGDSAALDRAAAGCDAVVHLAGAPEDAGFDAYLADDIPGVWHALEAARQAGVRRFVYASTAAVYGGWPGGTPITALTPLRPAALHAAVKALGEAHVLAAGRRPGFTAICVRLGPGLDAIALLREALDTPATESRTLP